MNPNPWRPSDSRKHPQKNLIRQILVSDERQPSEPFFLEQASEPALAWEIAARVSAVVICGALAYLILRVAVFLGA